MNIVITRKYPKADYTIGRMRITRPSGTSWYCDTLEPPLGTEAEMRTSGSKKAIPPGNYEVYMNWSQRFQDILPWLDTSGRSAILIHAGNHPRHTTGCILVGKNTRVGTLTESRKALARVITFIIDAKSRGEAITLTIK